MRRTPQRELLLATTLLASTAAAQDSPAATQEPTEDLAWELDTRTGFNQLRVDGDRANWLVQGGAILTRGTLEIRATNAIVVLDHDELGALREGSSSSGLPRRSTVPPPDRRAITEEVLRNRLVSLLGSARAGVTMPESRDRLRFQTVRAIYLEGDVVMLDNGFEVARASRLYVSATDDRAVFHDTVLRLRARGGRAGEHVLVVRGPKIVRQSGRITGRGVSVTTCDAGEPHFDVRSDEIEILERGDQFEVRSRGNALAIHGVELVPLPNATILTGEQTQFPLKGASVGYSSRQGTELGIDLGGTWNEFGGRIHESFGRPREEFRGDWRLGLGWIEERGFPIDGDLDYRVDGLYRGRTSFFHLDDTGENIREIQNRLDGSPILDTGRNMVRTENRIELGDRTYLDLTATWLDDPAVLSEFQQGIYFDGERPETSAFLSHAGDGWLATGLGRWNANEFSYAADRSLETAFVEDLPSATFDWFASPLFHFPDDTPLLFRAATEVGQLRFNFDDSIPGGDDERTLRFDQEAEVYAPFRAGAFGVQPYVRARVTQYDNTVDGSSRTRWAFEGGIDLSTRLQRTWRWAAEDGNGQQAFRHVIHPTVRLMNRFAVDGDPGDFHQFDEVDALDEFSGVRIGTLQRFIRSDHDVDEETRTSTEFLWIDLAQNITPNSERDNDGHKLGLFEFEAILRPGNDWVPVDDLQILFEGEHDWNADDLRTLNTYLQFDVAKVTWFGEYRTDRTDRGTIAYGAFTRYRDRWVLRGRSEYDLELRENRSYTVSLQRQDHDWRILVGLRFNNITDDTSLTFDFLPTLGGLIAPVRRSGSRYLGDRQLLGRNDYTVF